MKDLSIVAHNTLLEYNSAQARYERGEISYSHLLEYKKAWQDAEYLVADERVARMSAE